MFDFYIQCHTILQLTVHTPTAGYCMANWLQKYKHKGILRSLVFCCSVTDPTRRYSYSCSEYVSEKLHPHIRLVNIFLFLVLRGLVWCLLLANVPMALYFSLVHQRGPTTVMDFLRRVRLPT